MDPKLDPRTPEEVQAAKREMGEFFDSLARMGTNPRQHRARTAREIVPAGRSKMKHKGSKKAKKASRRGGNPGKHR